MSSSNSWLCTIGDVGLGIGAGVLVVLFVKKLMTENWCVPARPLAKKTRRNSSI